MVRGLQLGLQQAAERLEALEASLPIRSLQVEVAAAADPGAAAAVAAARMAAGAGEVRGVQVRRGGRVVCVGGEVGGWICKYVLTHVSN